MLNRLAFRVVQTESLITHGNTTINDTPTLPRESHLPIRPRRADAIPSTLGEGDRDLNPGTEDHPSEVGLLELGQAARQNMAAWPGTIARRAKTTSLVRPSLN
jgi:hypothetical protein